jgi:VanZ family protein
VSAFLRYWLPVCIWAAVIFWMSTEAGSTRHTSRIIGPILRWFNPAITDETVRHVQTMVRKTAHVSEYALLAILLWRARRRPTRDDPGPWGYREAIFAIVCAALFAATDEWHQTFVPGRQGDPLDALLDTAGATLGMLAVRVWWQRYRC